MKLRTIVRSLILFSMITSLACSSLPGIKGKFSEPVTGKALSLVARRVSSGGTGSSLMLEISNPSGSKIVITPLKLKVIADDGSETETTYNLQRSSLDQFEIAGGSIVSGTLRVASPNQNEPVQAGSPAALSQGEKIVFNLGPGGKTNPEKVQVSIGPDGSKDQEVFAIIE